jgi:hypothetical protein
MKKIKVMKMMKKMIKKKIKIKNNISQSRLRAV